MNLSEFETQFQKSFDIEKIKSELESGLSNLISDIENIEMKDELDSLLQNEAPLLEFAGVSVHLLNATKRKPFFFARLDIYKGSSNKLIAWYDIEYGPEGEILDDYMDFYPFI